MLACWVKDSDEIILFSKKKTVVDISCKLPLEEKLLTEKSQKKKNIKNDVCYTFA